MFHNDMRTDSRKTHTHSRPTFVTIFKYCTQLLSLAQRNILLNFHHTMYVPQSCFQKLSQTLIPLSEFFLIQFPAVVNDPCLKTRIYASIHFAPFLGPSSNVSYHHWYNLPPLSKASSHHQLPLFTCIAFLFLIP